MAIPPWPGSAIRVRYNELILCYKANVNVCFYWIRHIQVFSSICTIPESNAYTGDMSFPNIGLDDIGFVYGYRLSYIMVDVSHRKWLATGVWIAWKTRRAGDESVAWEIYLFYSSCYFYGACYLIVWGHNDRYQHIGSEKEALFTDGISKVMFLNVNCKFWLKFQSIFFINVLLFAKLFLNALYHCHGMLTLGSFINISFEFTIEFTTQVKQISIHPDGNLLWVIIKGMSRYVKAFPSCPKSNYCHSAS